MRTALTAALTMCMLVTAAADAAAPDYTAAQVQPYSDPKPAPAFALPDLQGRTHRLEDLRGKVVMVFFWATW
jgi:cytochrome oxidase Cu insertion factor (SCO1/SenC/PrrC family)